MEHSSQLDHCTFDDKDPSCPASGWQVFDEQYFPYWRTVVRMGAIPQALLMSGRSSLRQFTLRTRNLYNSESLLWANAFTLASVPPSVIADALVDIEKLWINAAANGGVGNYKFRRDASFTTEVAQPLVLARCSETDYKPGDGIKLLFPSFRNVTSVMGLGLLVVMAVRPTMVVRITSTTRTRRPRSRGFSIRAVIHRYTG